MVEKPGAIVGATSAEIEARVRDNLPLVGHLVREVLFRLPQHIGRDELTSAGMLALTLSARHFDAERGVPFGSYASQRIRGALLDELRGMDWAPRSLRRTAREARDVQDQLTAALGRSPSKAEHAAALGVSVTELDQVQSKVARAGTTSLDALPVYAGSDSIADKTAGPEALLLQREQLGYLHDAIEELPDRLRHIITEHFYGQRQFDDIARDLGVTASRVSQLYAEALRTIRDGMNAQLDPAATDTTPLSNAATTRRNAYREAIAQRSTLTDRLALTTPTADMHNKSRFAAVA
jgi:RNA polymerase sigma factor for flagellar operon FliA